MDTADKVLLAISSPEGQVILAVLIDQLVRRWPSINPQSLLHWLAGVLTLSSKMVKALADASDKALGQKLK